MVATLLGGKALYRGVSNRAAAVEEGRHEASSLPPAIVPRAILIKLCCLIAQTWRERSNIYGPTAIERIAFARYSFAIFHNSRATSLVRVLPPDWYT